MKKFYTIITALLLTATLWAQTPEKMSYQAVIRNSSDALVTNTTVGMQISILQGSIYGASVYVETQTPTTNANGLLTIEIGSGTIMNGDFGNIDWANGPYFIKTETDPSADGGTNYTITGTNRLLSVPYALHAKTAESISGTITETDPVFGTSVAKGITGTDTTNWNNKLDVEVDGSVTNEIQTISRTGLTVTLTDGGTYQDSVNTYTAGTGIDITNNVVSKSGHYIGELYGGGIVYYVYDNGQHGLIASLDDLDGGSGVAWSATDDIEIGASAKSMTNGSGNTAAIVAQDATVGYAATLCNSYTGGSFTDWYLPSNRELYLLCSQDILIDQILDNDGNVTTNGFSQEYLAPTYGRYWSSTESNNGYAWAYGFISGYSTNVSKYDTYRVRGVRAF